MTSRFKKILFFVMLAIEASLLVFMSIATIIFILSINSASLAQHVVEVSQDIKEALVDAETGQRGYIITGAKDYLEPYENARITILSQLHDLKLSTQYQKSTDSALVNEIINSANAKMDELASTLQARDEQGFDAAKQLVLNHLGANLMKKVRQNVNLLTYEQSRNIRLSQESVSNSGFVILACIITFTFLMIGNIFLAHNILGEVGIPISKIHRHSEKGPH